MEKRETIDLDFYMKIAKEREEIFKELTKDGRG